MKICGLTRADDARAAVDAGVDAVGVVLAPSPRQLSLDEAAAVLAPVPPPVARVGVFVDAAPEFVADAVARLGLTVVQFSGDESPQVCSSAPAPVLKVMQVGTAFDSEGAEPYRGLVAALLLDTLANGTRGGTGKAFAWHTVHELPAWAPVFVAGGLTPSNVGAAIRILRPFAVDVSSGVEERPRIKDHAKIEAFVAAVRAADQEVS